MKVRMSSASQKDRFVYRWVIVSLCLRERLGILGTETPFSRKASSQEGASALPS